MIAPEESVVTVLCRRSLLTVVSMWLFRVARPPQSPGARSFGSLVACTPVAVPARVEEASRTA